MAPEVASGAYSKQIDIYACGVMLYEMLTGEVPFKGESFAEIAIKHQTDLPDMSGVPQSYVPVLEKALNKKAERRFAGMNEMIQAIEAIGISKATMPASGPRTEASPDKPPIVPTPVATPRPAAPAPIERGKLSELASSLFLVPLMALPATAIWAAFTGAVNWTELGSLFLTMVMTSWAVLVPTKLWERHPSSKLRRLTFFALGAFIGLMAYGLSALHVLANFVLFFALALGLPRWWQAAERKRPERFTFYPVIAAGVCGLVLSILWNSPLFRPGESFNPVPQFVHAPNYFVLALAGAAAVVQLVSPWTPPCRIPTRHRRRLPSADSTR
jgi:hypothetical protein